MATKPKSSKKTAGKAKLSDKMRQFRDKPKAEGRARNIDPLSGKPKNAPRAKKAKLEGEAAAGSGVEKTADGVVVGSKAAQVIELMDRKGGATLQEITKFTDWQKHTVRGFVSGMLVKKLKLKVESTKDEAGVRSYAIAR